jgi:hypothetical protein
MSVYSTPIPGVAQQGMAANAAKLAYDRALAKIGQKRGDLLRQHGYTGQFDDKGNITNLGVDAQNPYGLYQQNRRAHALAGEQARSQAQSRGLSGGLARQFESRQRYDWGFDDAQQGQQLTRGISSLIGEQDEAYGQYNNALWQEQLELARQAILNQRFNQADYSGLDYPDYGSWNEDSSPPVVTASPIAITNQRQMELAADKSHAKKLPPKKAAPPPPPKPVLGYVRGGAPANVAKATQAINNAIKKAKPKGGK